MGSEKRSRSVLLSALAGIPRPRSRAMCYLVSACAIAAAFGLTMVTAAAQRTPVPFFTLAVLVSTLYGGKRSGWPAAFLAVISTTWLLLPQLAHKHNLNDAVRILAFALVAASMVVLVSKLRSTAEELNEKKEWLDVTLRSIGDGVIATDARGGITFMNGIAESLTGWQTDEALGQPLQSVFRIKHEVSGEPVDDPVANVIRSGGVIGLANHTVLVRKDGSELVIDDSAAPIRDRDGVLTGVVLIFRDFTRQRRLEQEREAARQQLERILARISEGFIACDRDLRYLYINDQAVKVLGRHSQDEFTGRTMREVLPEFAGTKFEGAFQRALSEQTPVRMVEHYAPLSAWLQVNAYPSAEGLTVLIQDVTQQVKSQQALELAGKLAATGRLASTIAHEINNPLAAVTNLVYLAKASSRLEQVHEYLRGADKELSRMAEIIRHTLGFVRANQAATPAAPLREILDEIVTTHGQRILERGIIVEKLYAADTANAVVPGEMRQVFGNLVSNAIDFVPIGGTVRLIAGASIEGEKLGFLVRVQDNGTGISPEHLEKIFDPFFTTKKDVGTGLGLWVSRQIVEKHGGSIRVESNVEPRAHGTTFFVFTPALQPEKAKAKAATAQ